MQNYYFNVKWLFYFTVLMLNCGRQIASEANGNQSARIIGGTPTVINKIRYLVYLRLDGQFICGGSLVTPQHIVTAAHCVQGVKPRSITVVGGATYLSDNGIRRSVAKIYLPKAFRMDTLHMDVAVLKLASPLSGTNIETIELCNTSWKAGNTVQVSGWGLMSENGHNPSEQVRSVYITLISKSSCIQMYRKMGKLTNTMFCASIPGSKDSCEGDSGGPVVFKGQLCGIVSWGVGCGRARYPGVYTNVKIVSPFITTALQRND